MTASAPDNAEKHGVDLFLQAAWKYCEEWLAERGGVPDVMILGRYADEELMFVFPSGQDQEMFRKACEAEAATFGADVALMCTQTVMSWQGEEPEVVAVFWRERGQPVRVDFAALAQGKLGPVSSLPGTQSNTYLDRVFGATVN